MYTLISLIVQVWCSLTRKGYDNAPVLDPAFVASFATPPSSNVRVMAHSHVTPEPAFYGTALTGEFVSAHTPELFLAACRAVESTHTYDTLSTLDWAQIADESLTHAKHAPVEIDDTEESLRALAFEIEKYAAQKRTRVQTPVRIEHFASSTERMRAQRAAYAAQGLTARGTVPQPVCEGTTKAGKPCKRKAQDGVTTCSLDHANTDLALSFWL